MLHGHRVSLRCVSWKISSSFHANSVTPPALPSNILAVFQSIILTFLTCLLQSQPRWGSPCWSTFSRRLLQKPLGKKLWSKICKTIKEALEKWLAVGRKGLGCVPPREHSPLALRSSWAAQLCQVFCSRLFGDGVSSGAGQSCCPLGAVLRPSATDTGAGLKVYLLGGMESHLLWPCVLSRCPLYG